jgi:hypothetical protein
MIEEARRWTRKSEKNGKSESTVAVAVEKPCLSAGLAPVAFRYAIAAWKRTCGG